MIQQLNGPSYKYKETELMNDNNEFKARIEAALNRHSEKQLNTPRTRKTKNQKPERDFVEKPCMKWLRDHGFDMNVIEASGGMNSFGAVTVKSGYADASGNDKHGRAVYVEFKAPKRRSTLKEHQRAFLERKINTNCFAVCVDSVDLLDEYYSNWNIMVSESPQKARKYLLSLLPKQRNRATNARESCPDLDKFLL